MIISCQFASRVITLYGVGIKKIIFVKHSLHCKWLVIIPRMPSDRVEWIFFCLWPVFCCKKFYEFHQNKKGIIHGFRKRHNIIIHISWKNMMTGRWKMCHKAKTGFRQTHILGGKLRRNAIELRKRELLSLRPETKRQKLFGFLCWEIFGSLRECFFFNSNPPWNSARS